MDQWDQSFKRDYSRCRDFTSVVFWLWRKIVLNLVKRRRLDLYISPNISTPCSPSLCKPPYKRTLLIHKVGSPFLNLYMLCAIFHPNKNGQLNNFLLDWAYKITWSQQRICTLIQFFSFHWQSCLTVKKKKKIYLYKQKSSFQSDRMTGSLTHLLQTKNLCYYGKPSFFGIPASLSLNAINYPRRWYKYHFKSIFSSLKDR